MIQEVAYQSLLRRTRQQYHQQIAQVLEAQESEIVAFQPEVLAQHYMMAGQPAQALPYWQQAGQHAIERSASVEALAHLRQGLAALATLPDTPERHQQELRLQVALGPVCMAIYGHAAPEVEHAYSRARELCHELGNTPALFPVLAGLGKVFHHACRLSVRPRVGPPMPGPCAADAGGHPTRGGPLGGGRHCVLAGPPRHRPPAYGFKAWRGGIGWQYRGQQTRYPVVPGVQCLAYLGVILWFQGYPDQALAGSTRP